MTVQVKIITSLNKYTCVFVFVFVFVFFFLEMLKKRMTAWEKVKRNVKLFNILLIYFIFLGLIVT